MDGKIDLVIALCGGGFIFFGMMHLFKCWRQAKRCRHFVKGTVAKMDRVRGEDLIFWRASFCYVYNDIDYKVTSLAYTSWKRYEVGDEVEMYVDEKHPEEYYIPREAKVVWITGIIVVLTGLFLIIGALIVSIVLQPGWLPAVPFSPASPTASWSDV